MAKSINPKGISGAGKNGTPPKTTLKGEGANRKEVTNVPGGTSARNTKGPGISGKGKSKGPKRKPESTVLNSGKLNIKKPGGGKTFPTTQKATKKGNLRGLKKLK